MKFGENCVSGSQGLTECSRQSAGGGDKDRGISPQRRMILPNGLGGWVDALQIWATNPPNIEKIRQGVG